MKEQIIVRFKLPMINDLSLVNAIVTMGYRKTGNKFTVAFNGSKGYLSNIEIICEGKQEAENRILVESLRNKNRSLKSILVNIFHSDENGVRVSLSKDEPKESQHEEDKNAVSSPAQFPYDVDMPY